MLHLPRSALLSPLAILLSDNDLPVSSAASTTRQQPYKLTSSSSEAPLRWFPLFAEPAENEMSPSLKGASQAAASETHAWEVMKLQLRLKAPAPMVVALGVPATEGASLSVRLGPCSVQAVRLRFKNKGDAAAKVSMLPGLRALQVLWKKYEQCDDPQKTFRHSSRSGENNSDSTAGAQPLEGGRTAWLLRVSEEELGELRQQQDIVRNPKVSSFP